MTTPSGTRSMVTTRRSLLAAATAAPAALAACRDAQTATLQPPAPTPAQPGTGSRPVLTVGPGQQYRLIRDAMDVLAQQAISAGRDQMDWRGTIQVLPVPSDLGYYADDYVPFRKPFGLMNHPGDLTLEALKLTDRNDRRQLVYLPIDTPRIEYGKAPFVVTGRFTMRGFRIDEKVPYGNIAAIRTEGDRVELLAEDCEFVNCGNGILGTSNGGRITMRRVLLDGNGGSGSTHNTYLGQLDEVLAEHVVSVRTMHGHLFKTRARRNTIRHSRFLDGPTGASSYGIDLPEGGVALIEDCTIHRGVNAENGPAIAFGEELRPEGIVPEDGRTHRLTTRNLTILSETSPETAFKGTLGCWNRKGYPFVPQGTKFYGPPRTRMVNMPKVGDAAWPGDVTILKAMPALDFSSPAFRSAS